MATTWPSPNSATALGGGSQLSNRTPAAATDSPQFSSLFPPHCTCSAMRSAGGGQAAKTRLPFIVGVAGGTASGKTSVCARIMEELEQEHLGVHERRVVTICQDSFYKALNAEEQLLAQDGKYNFDHPDALDADQIVDLLKRLISGEKVRIPVYDFQNNRPDPEKFDQVYPANVIIVEGILIFYFPALRDLFHLKLFVDMDADTRLARRVRRDNLHRGRTLENILRQYTMFVKPAFEDYCLPTKTYADIIIPRGAENDVAIQLICQHIMQYMAVSTTTTTTSAAVQADFMPTPSPVIVRRRDSRQQLLLSRLSSFPGRRPMSMNDAVDQTDRNLLSPTAAVAIPAHQRHRSTGAGAVSPLYGHSSAYRRACSFGNESSLARSENEEDEDDGAAAFETQVVHHRHHHPAAMTSTQVSRLRRERERSISVGSNSGGNNDGSNVTKTVSCEFVDSNSSAAAGANDR